MSILEEERNWLKGIKELSVPSLLLYLCILEYKFVSSKVKNTNNKVVVYFLGQENKKS